MRFVYYLCIAVLRKKNKSCSCRRVIASPLFLFFCLVVLYYLGATCVFALPPSWLDDDIPTAWEEHNKQHNHSVCKNTNKLAWTNEPNATASDFLDPVYFLSVSLSTSASFSPLHTTLHACAILLTCRRLPHAHQDIPRSRHHLHNCSRPRACPPAQIAGTWDSIFCVRFFGHRHYRYFCERIVQVRVRQHRRQRRSLPVHVHAEAALEEKSRPDCRRRGNRCGN